MEEDKDTHIKRTQKFYALHLCRWWLTAVSQDKEKYKEIPLIERGPQPDMTYAVTTEERKQIIIIVVGY